MEYVIAKKIIEENKKSYNTIAPDFDITRQTAWPEFESLAPYIKEGSRILDIGCGNGRLYNFLNRRGSGGLQYVGVDQSEELIKITHKNYSDTDFRVADVFDLPFKDGEFDVVAGIAFLHHIPSRELRAKVLKEIYRVLKPGGILFLTNWNLWQRLLRKKYKLPALNFFFSHDGLDAGDFWIPFRASNGGSPVSRYYHHFRKGELAGLAKEAGFKPVKFANGKNLTAIFKK